MKKASALWGGISLLIELVILILALVRGNWLIPLLLAVCAGWTLWLVLTQLLPVWRNNRAYSGLTVKENGEIYVEHEEDGRSELLNTLLDLPEKVYWPQLVKVLEREGIAAETMDSGLLLSW